MNASDPVEEFSRRFDQARQHWQKDLSQGILNPWGWYLVIHGVLDVEAANLMAQTTQHPTWSESIEFDTKTIASGHQLTVQEPYTIALIWK